jgi:prophage regulatory protein
MMADGKFPRPVKIGRRAVGWIEEDVNKWLRNKITQQSEQ